MSTKKKTKIQHNFPISSTCSPTESNRPRTQKVNIPLQSSVQIHRLHNAIASLARVWKSLIGQTRLFQNSTFRLSYIREHESLHPSSSSSQFHGIHALVFFDAIDDECWDLFQPFIDVVPKTFWTSLHNYVAKTVPQKNATIDKSEMVPKSAKRKECWRLWWEKQKIKKKWNCEGEKK